MLLRKLSCLLVLAIAISGCSEDVVKPESPSDWMLGTFSDTNALYQSLQLASLVHYEFRENGTLAVFNVTHCEENHKELFQEYKWSRAGDSLVIVEVPEDDIFDEWRITPGKTCGTLQLDQIQGGEPRGNSTLWRGEVCLSLLPPCPSGSSCPACETVWCDEAPPPCE